ncbi:hypothetical protein AWB74_08826 [Caballeronia arvi]|uniref:Uncharacterized protein n=1 Tax=Caballeronia arvi TaxID=1777135 RepID=A0A158L6I2_9BURK|nr:hypothetical protein AWB74_08826 [Caballeronia arvi]
MAFDHFRDDYRWLVARIRRNDPQRCLERVQYDLDARVLIAVGAFQSRHRFTRAQQRHPAAGHDAFLDCGTCGMQRVVHTVFLLLHFDLGGRADFDDGHATGELRHPLLQLLTIVVACRFLDLRTDRLHARRDALFVARAVDDDRVVLADFNALRSSEIFKGCLLQLLAGFFGDDRRARQGCDVLEHGFAPIAKAGRLHGRHLEDAAHGVDDQCRQRFAVDVLCDNQQWLPSL